MAEYATLVNMKTVSKSPMTSINISMPTNQRQFVEHKVSQGGYSTVSEYFRELVRQDEQREAEARLESLLLQSLESGEPTPLTKKDWDDVRKEVRRRAGQRKNGKSKG
jgi:antitoxin ParD1/3/4